MKTNGKVVLILVIINVIEVRNNCWLQLTLQPRLPVWSFNLFFFCVIDCCVILHVNREVSGGHLYDSHPARKCEVLSDKVGLKLSDDVGCKFLLVRSLHAGAVLKDAPGRDSRSGRGHLTPASNRNRNTTALRCLVGPS